MENGFFNLCNMTLCPSDKQCAMCVEVRDLVTNEDVKQAMKDKKIPIRMASCDNSLSFAKFVKRKLRVARLLQCSAHLNGTFILFSRVLPPATHGADFFIIMKALHGRSKHIEDFSRKRRIIDVFIVK